MTPTARRVLARLHNANEADLGLLDATHEGLHAQTLRRLERDRLALKVGEDLWRITLRGLLVHRGVLPETTPDHLRRPTIAEQVITYIHDHPGATSTTIADHLDETPVVITNALRKLTARGLIDRAATSIRGGAYAYYPPHHHR